MKVERDSDRPDYRPVSYGIGIVIGGVLALMGTIGVLEEVTRDDVVVVGEVTPIAPDWGDVFVAGVFAVVGLIVVVRSFRGLQLLRTECHGGTQLATVTAPRDSNGRQQSNPLGTEVWTNRPDSPSDLPPPMAAAGWYPDPHGRFEGRYWNGTAWTKSVLVEGVSVLEPDVQ
jgi:hypothetical protein